MSNIKDLVTAEHIGSYWTEAYSKSDPFLGNSLFTPIKISGNRVEWFKGKEDLDMELDFSTFDANPELRDREDIEMLSTKLLFFREAMKVKEEDLMTLNSLLANNPMYNEIVSRIYRDRAALVEAARVRVERMRMQMLQGGKITIYKGGILAGETDFGDDDYRENNTVTLTGSSMWSNTDTSTPFEDIRNAINSLTDRGESPAYMILNDATWRQILASDSVLATLYPMGAPNVALDSQIVKNYIASVLGIDIIVYNKTYKDKGKIVRKFVEDGNVVIIPAGTLGRTVFSQTPHETEATELASNGTAVTTVDTGITIATFITGDGIVNVNTVVEQQVLPIFERINSTFFIKAY